MPRFAVLVAAAVLLTACGDEGSSDADDAVTSSSIEASSSTVGGGGASSSSTVTVPAGPATTVDLDGREPDRVEPPPIDGVPTSAVPATGTTRHALPGFGEVVVEVQRVDGRIVSWCLLLAETSEQTQRGLMEVTDPELGGYDGMLFRFEADHDGGFYMRNTPQPLSIAYLDAEGAVVSITRMEPCDDIDGCPTYVAEGPFRRTIEVPIEAGGVARLGIEPGAVVVDTGRTCAA